MKLPESSGKAAVACAGVGLLLAVTACEALADPRSYGFAELARTGGAAPGNGTFKFDVDIEPWTINSSGNVAFAADIQLAGTNMGQGVFASRQGQLLRIAQPGDHAPGGGTFAGIPGGCCELSHMPLNDAGDGAFIYELEPFDPTTAPFGLNAGLYRFSLLAPTPTAVVVPGTTPAPTPTGGVFAGVFFDRSLNNQRDLMFAGISPKPPQIPCPGSDPCDGLGIGVFKADRTNHVTSIVGPGDPAPGAGVFDGAQHGWINNAGAIAFEAHVKDEECIPIGTPFLCGGSVYKRSAKGQIQSIAHIGDPAPGGGNYRLAYAPVMNSSGDVVFIGDLTLPPDVELHQGVFFFDSQKGKTVSVVRPADKMPGGGNFVTASSVAYQYSLNNPGDVAFIARLDTHTPGLGNPADAGDTGLYVASHGSLQLVARTGTVIPGVGPVAQVNAAILSGFTSPSFFAAGGAINDRGQILFEVTLTDQETGVLLVATPHGSH